jgi:hypothetical protein
MSEPCIIRGVTGEQFPYTLDLDELFVNLKLRIPEFDRESLFCLSSEGSKLDVSDFRQYPVILFMRSDFSETCSVHISDLTNFHIAMKALEHFLTRRRGAFVSAIAGFVTAVEAHATKASEYLGCLDAVFENVKKVELHASLVTEERKTLLDVVPQQRIAEFKTQLDRQILELLVKIGTWKSDANQVCDIIAATAAGLDRAHSSETANPFSALLAEVGRTMAAVRKSEMAGVLLEEAFARSRKSLGQLEHLEKMPLAYEKTLTEIVRRRIFKNKYLARVEAVRAELATARTEENERRKKFFNKYAVHLPTSLVPGLGDVVASVGVELTGDFDCELPLVLGNSSQMSSSSLEPANAASIILAPGLAASQRFLQSSEY